VGDIAEEVEEMIVLNRCEYGRIDGRDWIDQIKSHPQGEIRGLTKIVKITEDVRKFAAEQGISENEALEKGLKERPAEFVKKGSKVYAKT
jgi:hypothetical protein